jgi:CHASE2 domain-containing sensor protein
VTLSTGPRLAAAAALCLVPHVAVAASTRALLVLAALALVWCATRPRTASTRQVARAATLGIGAAAALAASRGAPVPVVCAVLALFLVVPPVWRRRGVFVPGAADR